MLAFPLTRMNDLYSRLIGVDDVLAEKKNQASESTQCKIEEFL